MDRDISCESFSPFNHYYCDFEHDLTNGIFSYTQRYTDSLVKSLAVGGAIVLTTFFGWLFLGGTMDLPVWIGCACVILSMFNYKDG